MPDILIRDVPDALKRRAQQHRRSLQQELLTILEAVVQEPGRQTLQSSAEWAASIRARLAQSGRPSVDSTPLMRDDHEQRH